MLVIGSRLIRPAAPRGGRTPFSGARRPPPPRARPAAPRPCPGGGGEGPPPPAAAGVRGRDARRDDLNEPELLFSLEGDQGRETYVRVGRSDSRDLGDRGHGGG